MIYEVNKIIKSIGDYNITIASRDIPISRRKALLTLPDRSNNDTILLTIALAKFTMNNKLDIFNDNWGVLLDILDQLAIIQYSILYYINPEYIVNITDGSELIDILPIEEVLAIGEYCDSIVENGIGSIPNYKSIYNAILNSQSPFLNELIASRKGLSDSDVEFRITEMDGENPVQAKYEQYLAVFSIIYLNMFKMIEKYMEPYNELNDFNPPTSYFIAVSSYVIINAIPGYDESHIGFSRKYNKRVVSLYNSYTNASVYTLNEISSESNTPYDDKHRILMYEFKNNGIPETKCSSNITFDEYAFFSMLGLSIHMDIDLRQALEYLTTYKVRVFAKIKKHKNEFEVLFEFERYVRGKRKIINDSAIGHRIVIIDIEHIDPTLNNIENAILHEIAYNFPKYAHVINRVALTLNENYAHKLIDGIYDGRDKTSKILMSEYNSVRLTSAYISLGDIPNINDLYKRANHQSKRINDFFERFVNN